MYEWCIIQLEQPEYNKNDQNTASRLCDKEENYTFSMRIARNENYSSWEQERFEHVQNFRACLPKYHRWEVHYSNSQELARMTRNDPWSNKNGQLFPIWE